MNALIEFLNAWGARFAGFALPMLLQSAVLIALLFALDWALRQRVRATIRYAVWMLALLKLALPPSLALPTGAAYWLFSERPGRNSAPAIAPAMPPVSAPEQIATTIMDKPASAVRASTPLVPPSPVLARQAVVFLLWLAVALGMAIWVVWRSRLVFGVIRQSVEAPETVRNLLESCRRQLGIKRPITVHCAAIGSPAICGVLRPIILIPPGLVDDLTGAEMRAVLLHELAHHKRADLWVNHAQILLQVLYWYNPLLWLANAGIRRAREQAVDEMVLVEMAGEAPAYPATLLHVAKLGLGRPLSALGLMGILEPGRGLTSRIVHIMNRPLPRTARIGAGGFASVLLLALVALPMASHPENARAGTTETVRIEGVVRGPYQTLYFTLWQSGCKWMYQVSTDSNVDLKLARSTVSYDGTNCYHFSPASRGTHLLRDAPDPFKGVASINTKLGLPNFEPAGEPFQGMGSVDAKPVWRFAAGNGPLWWAYASACVLKTNGPAPNFLVPWDERVPFSLKRVPVNETVRRVGPINATLSANLGGSRGEQTIAEIHPLKTNDSDGIRFITKCEVITYGAESPKPGEWTTNWSPVLVPKGRWEIVLNKFGVEHTPVSFVPEIPAIIEAGRTVRARIEVTTADGTGSYLADHWLSENELKSNGVQLIKLPVLQNGPPAVVAASAPTIAAAGNEVIDSISLDDIPLPQAILQLAAQCGLNIQFDPALHFIKAADGTPVPQPRVQLRWKQVSANQALQALLVIYNLQMDRNPANPIVTIRRGDPDAAAPPVAKVNLLEDASPPGGDEVVASIVLDGIPLIDAIRQLAVYSRLNIQFDPAFVNQQAADGTALTSQILREKWKNISARQALQSVLDNYNLQLTRIPGVPILSIVPKNPATPDTIAKPSPPK